MASGGKKKTTMAKLSRESRLRERRMDKKARKDARKLAALPALKARIRKSDKRNIGWATLVSIRPKRPRISTPPMISLSTMGLVQPIVWWP